MKRHSLAIALAATMAAASIPALASVSAEEAATLKTTLTPLGAEKAGTADGSIPAWTGAAPAGAAGEGKRSDPFASEKPLFSITAQNMDRHAERLTDGVKAMFRKYPEYRIDVYKTHRTAVAPQWVYDNTAKNATQAKLRKDLVLEGAHGGIPFPIPKSGAEAMWNHLLRWRGEAYQTDLRGILVTAEGKQVMTFDAKLQVQMPYYFKEGPAADFAGDYWHARMVNVGPPIRAGEGIAGRLNVDDDKSQNWVYLAGQRRVRKLPLACCDTPTPATAGIMNFDDIAVWSGRLDRFEWKLLGKKEMYIPYNTNRSWTASKDQLIGQRFLNPDHVRWELHRVWVVEANVAPGQRHTSPKARFYLDEDTWNAVLGDRWDAKGTLWKTTWMLPVVLPDVPGTIGVTDGFYDLVSGAWFANSVVNDKPVQYRAVQRLPATVFTPDALAGESIR